MTLHDWTRAEPWLFHDFHLGWVAALLRALNSGLLPFDHYALSERPAGFAIETMPAEQPEIDVYASKANRITIRHTSNHKVVAVLEIVSPGNKNTRPHLNAFVSKAVDFLRAGIHLLIVDLSPPTPRDPQGIPKLIWDEFEENDFTLPPDRPLTLAAYSGGPGPEAFIQPVAVGQRLIDMPLFLTPEIYVYTPLDATYQSAWEAVPAFWREVLENRTS